MNVPRKLVNLIFFIVFEIANEKFNFYILINLALLINNLGKKLETAKELDEYTENLEEEITFEKENMEILDVENVRT